MICRAGASPITLVRGLVYRPPAPAFRPPPGRFRRGPITSAAGCQIARLSGLSPAPHIAFPGSLVATCGRWCRYKPLVSALLQKVAEVHRIVSIARLSGLSDQIHASSHRLRNCHCVLQVPCLEPLPPVRSAVRYRLGAQLPPAILLSTRY